MTDAEMYDAQEVIALRAEVARLTRALEVAQADLASAASAALSRENAERADRAEAALEEARAEVERVTKDRDEVQRVGELDYRDMRRFQAKYIAADQRAQCAESEVSRLRGQVEGAWRAGVEAAAVACEEEAERCLDAARALDLDEEDGDQVFAQNILLDQAGRIRLLPPPSAPADDIEEGGPFIESSEEAVTLLDRVANFCDLQEAQFDSIGEDSLIPNVKAWEARRKAVRAALDLFKPTAPAPADDTDTNHKETT